MSEPFVTFPGTTANYVFTDDVNLLDADDAHFHQSIGNWAAGAGASTLAQDTGGSPSPQFGDGTAKATTDGSGAVIATLTTPTLTAVQHTIAIDVYADTAGREAFITLDGTDGTVVALTQNAWTRVTVSKVVTAGTKAVSVTYRQTDDSDPAASEEVWLDQACLVAGSDGSFVPSLRIVGDFDLRVDAAPDKWVDSTARNAYWSRFTFSATTAGLSLLTSTTANNLGVEYVNTGGTFRTALSGDLSSYLGDAERHTLRATGDFGSDTVTFYVDGTSRGTASLFTDSGMSGGAQDAHVGEAVAVVTYTGDIYSVELRDGIGGEVVARFDANDVARALQ